MEYPIVKDCAVFGIKDEMLGEKIVAMIVLDANDVDDDFKVCWYLRFTEAYYFYCVHDSIAELWGWY